MQFAHSGNDRLPRLIISGDLEGRIFSNESLQGLAQPIQPISLGWRDSHLDHRLWHEHALKRTVFVLGRVGVTAGRVDAHHRNNVTGFG